MHDEVSETENIRNNLAIERIIVGGCDILLDVNNVFIRKGSVIQVLGSDKTKFNRSRIGSFRGDKEIVRQCYLFTNHMLLCTRTSGGKLTLLEVRISQNFAQQINIDSNRALEKSHYLKQL